MAFFFSSYGHASSSGGGDLGAPCKMIQATASNERGQMQSLNDRLSSYIQRVRSIRLQGQSLPSGYKESMRILEEEIIKLKGLYEAELDRLRTSLDAANRDKAVLTSSLDKASLTVAGHQAKVNEEANRARGTWGELEAANRSIAQLQKEVADLQVILQARDNEIKELKPEWQRVLQENADLKTRLEVELKSRLQTEGSLKAAFEKGSFDGQAKDQRIRDLEDRLRATGDIVVNLETRISQLTQGDHLDINGLLQKLREGTAAEIRRHQQETEAALSRSLAALRAQIEEETRAKGILGQERGELATRTRQMEGVIADLEAKLKVALEQGRSAEEALNAEKARAQDSVRDLERRLRELQEAMMAKMRECTGARDAQLSLQTEIDTYKSLLEVEEKALSAPVTSQTEFRSSSSNIGVMTPSAPPITRSAACGPILSNRNDTYRNATTYSYAFGSSAQRSTPNTNVKRISVDYTPYRPRSFSAGPGNYYYGNQRRTGFYA